MKKRKAKLSTSVVIGIIILLVSFGLIADTIGYQQFTKVLTSEYQKNALEIAKEAASYIDVDDINGYIESKGTSEAYLDAHERLQSLCNHMDAFFIYVVLNNSRDFMKCTFAIEAVNQNQSTFSEFPPGFVFDISDPSQDPYRETFAKMNRQNLDETSVIIEGTDFDTGQHMASVVSLRDQDGNIKAFLLVQKQMESLVPARAQFVQRMLFLTLSLIILAGAGWYLYLRRRLLTPIQLMAKETVRFASENTILESSIGEQIVYQDELGDLALSIENMEKKTLQYFEEKQRVSSELELATIIQSNMLPSKFPAFPDHDEFNLYAIMEPAKEVGGDFYDFFLVDDTHLAILIADVSGKGVPAALFMARSKALIQMFAVNGLEPSEVFYRVNNQLCRNNESGLFVTCWMGILDLASGSMQCVNAGHNPPIIRTGDSPFAFLKIRKGLVLGAMEGMKYAQTEISFGEGDRIYLYTDGVTEATASDYSLYGEKRLLRYLNAEKDSGLADILHGIKKDVDDFAGDMEQFDDVTMLILEFKHRSGPA